MNLNNNVPKKLALFTVIFVLVYVSLELARQINYFGKSKDLNLVIISIDTLRPDHMGVYGYSKNTTPNIDKFSKSSIVFTNATTTVPMTHPSFISLMTGYDPLKTRVLSNNLLKISDNTKTLASELKAVGYKTAAFLTSEPLEQGFDKFNFQIFKYYQYDSNGSEQYRQNNRFEYESFIKKSLGWFTNNRNNKFFAWIHLMDVHAPYFPPQDLRCKFNKKYCGQINGKSIMQLDDLRAEYQKCQNGKVPNSRVELMQTLYDGGIASADRLTGKILDSLRKNGLLRNTIVVIYGDHGEGFDHNYFFDHRLVLYNSALKIPLIIYHPLRRSGTKSDISVQNVDILPTLLSLLRVKDNSSFDGISFANLFNPNPLINSSLVKYRKYKFAENSNLTKFSVSDNEYKYIYSLPGSCIYKNSYEELYDLKKDKFETNNLIHALPKVADSLKKVLYNHLAPYNLPSNHIYSEDKYKEMDESSSSAIDENKVEQLKSLQY